MRTYYVVMLAGLVFAGALALRAQERKPEASRVILERHDQSGVAGKEIVIGTATLPKGASVGFHTHPGDEAGYVVHGPLILKTRGQPDKTLQTGDSFFNPRGAVHSLEARDADGLAVSSWIIDKGAALATAAP